ncbi:hypothetical protein [Streptomyces sp. NPDC002994]|uniref:hypothetical protein n=1 Tax=Streptomyces sp. NPDC002994 TaxID=3154441 RepID=UPI0033B227DF
MADSTDQAAAGEVAGPTPLQQAWGVFILHIQDCATCRTGIDCADAATLKATLREARAAA